MNDTVTKGRHSELLAIVALLANGYDVAEPVAPRAFDLTVKLPNSEKWVQMQVKTARARADRNGEVVVYAKKNNGKPYTYEEAQYIIGIYDGEVYLFENREIGEYWVNPNNINDKWEHLPLNF